MATKAFEVLHSPFVWAITDSLRRLTVRMTHLTFSPQFKTPFHYLGVSEAPSHVSSLSTWVFPYPPGYVFPLPFGMAAFASWVSPTPTGGLCLPHGIPTGYPGVVNTFRFQTPLGLFRSAHLRCDWGGFLLYAGARCLHIENAGFQCHTPRNSRIQPLTKA